MSHSDLIRSLQRRLETNRQNLLLLLGQRDMHGEAYVPPVIVNGIREARQQIMQIKSQLRQLGVHVADLPTDQDGEAQASAAPAAPEPPAEEVLAAGERITLADLLLEVLVTTLMPFNVLLNVLPLTLHASVRQSGVMRVDLIALLDQFASRRMLLSDGSHPIELVLGRATYLADGLALQARVEEYRTLVRRRLGRD